ncbi:MAG: hypothetical protein GXP58_08980 [Deltaproteobacteria bacterium]|nr:hypothetical protein [Deltaproteobacteria bacterium]
MCMAIEKKCSCNQESARFHHQNSILPFETIANLYCPACSKNVEFNAATMIADNGWIIEYDMTVAEIYGEKMGLTGDQLTPERIFDEGYCTWQGFTPNDLKQANEEKEQLAELAKTDMKRYIQSMKEWSVNRHRKLHKEGWRKAGETVGV